MSQGKNFYDKIQELGLEVMPWPAQSPHLNPIENSWKLLKARISTEKCTNADELWQVIEKKWKEVSENECSNLFFFMKHKCQ